MIVRILLVAFALLLSARLARGEVPPRPDALSAAYNAAITQLCAGMDRQQIVDRLKPIVEKNSSSVFYPIANEFLTDLDESVPPKAHAAADKDLSDTQIPFSMLYIAWNWERSLEKWLEQNREDPASELLTQDRRVIDRLITRLTDRTPTRANCFRFDGHPIEQPRVCDVALAMIEYHSLCRFHHDTIHGRLLHQLSKADRAETVKRVEEWWSANRDKSVVEGVRAQLPHAKSYPEKVWMAKNLVRLGEAQMKTDDKEVGLNVLRDMVKQNSRGHVGAYAANALAELGDTSSVDVFYDAWHSWLGRRGLIHDSSVAFYLCRHGKRREWELLHAISLEEIRDDKGPGQGAVWACVVNSGVAVTNPYAIPILGLALGQTETSGSRYIDEKVGAQSVSYADEAAEYLQKQLGKDFGYMPSGTADQRRLAIEKASNWWEHEGKAKYTFDYIEENLVPNGKAR